MVLEFACLQSYIKICIKIKELNSMLQCFCSNNGFYYNSIYELIFIFLISNLNEMYISFFFSNQKKLLYYIISFYSCHLIINK
jgi:hypothetical protein